jgi:hypothetical protein
MTNDHREDSHKQINKVGKSIQDLVKKVNNIDEKFTKETDCEN